jgi:hypothetical protein
MRKFFASRLAIIAVFFLFTSAFTWNLVHGASATVGGHFLAVPDATLLAHAPSIPPDPWDGVRIAHAPSIPPDPWDGVRIAHAPSIPPDPWDGVRIAHAPSIPPDPWDGVRMTA